MKFRLHFVVLWCWTVCAHAVQYESIGISRIIEGSPAEIRDHPHQAAMFTHKDGVFAFVCGASIISEWFVLTSAHCSKMAVLYKVGAGGSDIYNPASFTEVEKVIPHPNYITDVLDNDIAIAKLIIALSLSEMILPVRLPPHDKHPPVGSYVNVTGWGKTMYADGDFAKHLQVVSVPVIDWDCCRMLYNYQVVTERMFCTGLTMMGHHESWHGDNGGPAVANGILLGLIQVGRNSAAKSPAVKIKVGSYLKWIRANTGI